MEIDPSSRISQIFQLQIPPYLLSLKGATNWYQINPTVFEVAEKIPCDQLLESISSFSILLSIFIRFAQVRGKIKLKSILFPFKTLFRQFI